MSNTDTALIALTGNGTALTEVEAAILAELADDQNAFIMQPPRIKIAPGGIGKFLFGEETEKTVTGIVAISRIIRGYWPDSGTGAPPLCSSPDGQRGVFNANPSEAEYQAAMRAPKPHPGIVALTENRPLPAAFGCAACPLNQWGSEHQRRGGNGGKGKACKEMRRLLIFVEGTTVPALMTLPPTSIKAWDAYCSGLKARKGAYFAVRTRFELDKATAAGGETYNVVKVSMVGALAAAEIAQVGELRRQYRELVEGMAVNAEEYETVDAEGHAIDGDMPTFHANGDDNENPF